VFIEFLLMDRRGVWGSRWNFNKCLHPQRASCQCRITQVCSYYSQFRSWPPPMDGPRSWSCFFLYP
jgi:hypothetical protein